MFKKKSYRKKNNYKCKKTKLRGGKPKSMGKKGSVKLIKYNSVRKVRNAPMYRGLGYDMLMAYIYLIKKYKKNLCIAIGNKETIKREFDPTYIGLVYERRGGESKFFYQGDMVKLYEFIINCKKRFFAIPLSIEYPDSGPHFNILVGDTKNKTIERFEPYGAFIDDKVHASLDKNFKKFLQDRKLSYSYKNPDDFCPATAFQNKEEKNISKKKASVRKNDYRGYCGMWSVWFIEMKLKNPNKSSKILLESSLKKMKGENYRKFIRNYKNHIIEIRKEILREGGVDCRGTVLGMSPDYFTFKKCAKEFMDKKLDDFF